MIGLLSRALRRSRPARPFTRHCLGLERLEGRDCPSGGLEYPGGGGGGEEGTGDGPAITFTYSHGPDRTVRIEGTVTDSDPDGLTVTISGIVAGTATTNSTGNFMIQLPASELGEFRAQTINRQNQESNYYTETLSNSAPSITVGRHMESSGWVIDGTIGDEYTDGLTVTFSSSIGMVNGHHETVSSGAYFWATGETNLSGTVTVMVTDWWGEVAYASTSVG